MSDKYILRVIAEAACERLMQQIDQLKADVENVTNDNIRLSQENGGLRGERDRLKADVERFKFTLEEERQITRQDWAGLRCEHDRVKRALEQAEADVERLRKAGDELALSLAAFHLLHRGKIDTTTQPDIVAWNAAKEGKDL